jgi:hypothetical protein
VKVAALSVFPPKFVTEIGPLNAPAGTAADMKVPVQHLERGADGAEGDRASANKMVATNQHPGADSAVDRSERCNFRDRRGQPCVQHPDAAWLHASGCCAATFASAIEFAVGSLHNGRFGIAIGLAERKLLNNQPSRR